MKLISLNTWGATQGQIFFDYIKEQSADADIFCFQEIYSATEPAPKISSGARMYLLEELTELLQDFSGIFAQNSSGYDFNGAVDFPVCFGLAVFIKNSIQIVSSETVIIDNSAPKADPIEGVNIAQVLTLKAGDKNFTVINYHGPAMPGTKLDTEQRLNNSQKLKQLWQGLPNMPKILCGDFNLMPETESIKNLGEVSKNLITEYSIENTRNEISWKRFNNKQYFADFTFASPELKIKNFTVPYNLVSDHLPMILEFKIEN